MQQSDPLQRIFVRPFFLSLTIGIPFCVFKLIFGLSATRAGITGLVALGWIVIAWACADLAMNIGRSAYDLAGRSAPFEYCTIAQVGRRFGRPVVFLAIDTLLIVRDHLPDALVGLDYAPIARRGNSLVRRDHAEPDQPLGRLAL